MAVRQLLDRLQDVRERAPGGWMAKCPAHEDRSPSLSIREKEDGVILLHCFAGCSASDVLEAVGLGLTDLYPERLDHHIPPRREGAHRHSAQVALKVLAHESLIVAIAAENITCGVALDDIDLNRLREAADCIRRIVEISI